MGREERTWPCLQGLNYTEERPVTRNTATEDCGTMATQTRAWRAAVGERQLRRSWTEACRAKMPANQSRRQGQHSRQMGTVTQEQRKWEMPASKYMKERLDIWVTGDWITGAVHSKQVWEKRKQCRPRERTSKRPGRKPVGLGRVSSTLVDGQHFWMVVFLILTPDHVLLDRQAGCLHRAVSSFLKCHLL